MNATTITDDQLRALALAVLGSPKAGPEIEPEPAPTFLEIAERYREEQIANGAWRESTRENNDYLIRELESEFGMLPIDEIGPDTSRELLRRWGRLPVVGLRIKMLCRIQRYAADCGVPVGIDAMHRIKLPAIRTRERYLSPLELSALGRAVEAAERDGSITESAARCIRGLALTGMRISEFATLTWDEIDLSAGRICLRDSKTGARIVPIGTEVVRWLTTINRHGAYVCPGRDPSRPITSSGVRHALESVSERAGLRGVTPHVLRHTYATTALQGGEPLSSIQQILGHSNPQTTARYLHVCEHESRVSATRTAGTISGALTGGASEDGDR